MFGERVLGVWVKVTVYPVLDAKLEKHAEVKNTFSENIMEWDHHGGLVGSQW